MSDLVIKIDVIERMRVDLGRLQTEFENANANSDSVAESVGHPYLGDKVRNFAHNWDQRRKDLVDQIKTIQDNMAEIQKQFDIVDEDFANSLEGKP